MSQTEQEMFKGMVDNIGDYIWKAHCQPNMENVLRYYRAKVTAAAAGGKITIQVPYEGSPRQVRCSARATNLAVGDQCLVMVYGDASNAIVTGKADLSDTTGGGGGSTTNYNDLTNKPQINGTTLSGNKTFADLGLSPYSDIPAMDSGAGAAGSSTAYSRGDHVHPTDTSRQATITASGILKGNGSGNVTAATAGTDYQAPLPSQSGQSGKYLTTNGTTLSWGTPSGGGGGTPYDTNPEMDGIASPGASTAYSRGDHVHPTDTSRQAKIMTEGILEGDGAGNISAAATTTATTLEASEALTLSIDSTPTENSNNLVTSGGVYAFVMQAIADALGQ